MKALVIGATGATGKDLVQTLLQDPFYTEVVIFVRRSTGMGHPKLTEVVTDFNKPGMVSPAIHGDILFSCLGTTLKAAGSKEEQLHIDYEIPASFAEIAKGNGVDSFVLLSAYGASPASRVFYSRTKGELEEKIKDLGFSKYIVFRPGLLLRKNSDRPGERLSASLLKVLNAIGILRKFRPMPTSLLAEKMARSARILPQGIHIISLDRIFGF